MNFSFIFNHLKNTESEFKTLSNSLKSVSCLRDLIYNIFIMDLIFKCDNSIILDTYLMAITYFTRQNIFF